MGDRKERNIGYHQHVRWIRIKGIYREILEKRKNPDDPVEGFQTRFYRGSRSGCRSQGKRKRSKTRL